jgi:ketosteroid isomerase-like protein
MLAAVEASGPEQLAATVRSALESGDLEAYGELLAPDVRWGPPGDDVWGCHNRTEVLAWYAAARGEGMSAEVDEVVAVPGALIVGLRVSRPGGPVDGGSRTRWQVLTVRDGRITDICGFDDRETARAYAGSRP